MTGICVAAICLGFSAAVIASLKVRFSRLNAIQSERLLDAVHEIRRPLTALMLGIEVLEREVGGAEDKGFDPALTAAALKGEVSRVGLVADRLVGISGAVRVQRAVDLSDLAAAVAAGWQPQLAACGRNIVLDLATDPGHALVSADADQIGQATSNLLANAVEHGEGPVRVKVERRGDAVEVSVRNRTRSRGSGGASSRTPSVLRGRGLRIANDLVTSNGGWLKSSSGRTHEAVFAIDLIEAVK